MAPRPGLEPCPSFSTRGIDSFDRGADLHDDVVDSPQQVVSENSGFA